MSFTEPTILVLLAVPVLLLLWAWQRKGWGFHFRSMAVYIDPVGGWGGCFPASIPCLQSS